MDFYISFAWKIFTFNCIQNAIIVIFLFIRILLNNYFSISNSFVKLLKVSFDLNYYTIQSFIINFDVYRIKILTIIFDEFGLDIYIIES